MSAFSKPGTPHYFINTPHCLKSRIRFHTVAPVFQNVVLKFLSDTERVKKAQSVSTYLRILRACRMTFVSHYNVICNGYEVYLLDGCFSVILHCV